MMMDERPGLHKGYLKELYPSPLTPFSLEVLEYPIRVVQFGEGNFLRGFLDWMLQEMNKEGVFQGRAAVVQPIPGSMDSFHQQDSLYTLVLRGLSKGESVEKKEIITSIGEVYSSSSQWEEVLSLAKDPLLEFVVSNTTEAGIAYDGDDSLEKSPPSSYPGKLAAYLYHRYQHFQGDREKGMVILPVELIDRNGDKLRSILLQLIEDWRLSLGFREWLIESCHFLNTLVDRIITGYPHDEIEELSKELGYQDELLVTGEVFHLWVIEGESQLRERLPFHQVGLQVKWVEDLTPYRTRKVRILNGAHTLSVAPAFLSGIDTVQEAVEDETLSTFIEEAIYQEIIPTIEMDREELEDFAKMVLERFKNPFIAHRWLDISLNSTSKFKTRVLPSLLHYVEREEALPKLLLFSLASLLFFYKGKEISGDYLRALRGSKEYVIYDDMGVLKTFLHHWQEVERGERSLKGLVIGILGQEEIWGEDLTKRGIVEAVTSYLKLLEDRGMAMALKEVIGRRSS